MEFQLLTAESPLWEKMKEYAARCSWSAGKSLAQAMENGAFTDWERVIAAAENGSVVGYCTFTEQDELPEAYGFSPFIGFVFVDEGRRGNRISQGMIEAALRYAGSIGYETVYLMSGERGLYEKYGFTKLGEYDTIYGTRDQLFSRSTSDPA